MCEFDHQQKEWKMTTGWGGVRLAASVEDEHWAARIEFDSQKGGRG